MNTTVEFNDDLAVVTDLSVNPPVTYTLKLSPPEQLSEREWLKRNTWFRHRGESQIIENKQPNCGEDNGILQQT